MCTDANTIDIFFQIPEIKDGGWNILNGSIYIHPNIWHILEEKLGRKTSLVKHTSLYIIGIFQHTLSIPELFCPINTTHIYSNIFPYPFQKDSAKSFSPSSFSKSFP